ncbi:uncharacterized protein VTP21DRAFT_4636 [Calcarisporiella thermophila]|uniref:uncharacterized protein n=1 Tax=Calcarisporiella thermophila TaxID=911321 RepID=UPI003742F7EE
MPALHTLRRLALLSGVSLTTCFIADNEFGGKVIQRTSRLAYNGMAIAIDYKLNFKPEKADLIEDLHTRAANRILNVCRQNGGLYIKLGQGISTQAAVLPAPFQRILRVLYDSASHVPFSKIVTIFKQDFGKHPDDIFIEFERVPIASASIAQVHRARLKDGTPVAVKVQKPEIAKQLDWDIWAYKTLFYLYEKIFDLPIYWSTSYTEAQLRQETDFLNEGKNAELARRHLQEDVNLRDRVYIPDVYWDYCSKRVLVAEWIDGVQVTEAEKVRSMGFRVADIMDAVVSYFAFQIMQSGHVHADPHPGNVFVRPHPHRPSRPQIVVLDHGLYIHESEEFRRQYCQLWKALFMMDTKKVNDICQKWGIRESEMFASFTLQRPYSPSKPLHLSSSVSLADTYRLQSDLKNRARNFLSDAALFPRELLFIVRNMSIVRANNKTLGSPVNRINIMARYAVRGEYGVLDDIYDIRDVSPLKATVIRISRNFHSSWNRMVFRVVLWSMSVVFWWTQVRDAVWTFFGGRSENFEELMDKRLALELEKVGIKVDLDAFDA